MCGNTFIEHDFDTLTVLLFGLDAVFVFSTCKAVLSTVLRILVSDIVKSLSLRETHQMNDFKYSKN